MGLIETSVLQHLSPIVIIGLGWIGFLYGSHLEYKQLRRFRSQLFLTAFGESLSTFVLVAVTLYALSLWGLLQFDPIAIVLLSSTAACTAPVTRFSNKQKEDGATFRLAHFCSQLDDLPGLLALGVLFSITPPSITESAALSTAFWFMVHLLVGTVFGVITHYLYETIESAAGETDPGELTLVFFGMLSLTSGFAAYLDLSPLFVGVVSGLAFANISHHSDTLAAALAEREHTVYVLFLLVSGCYWPFQGFTAWLPLTLYLLVRLLGKIGGSLLARNLFLKETDAEAVGASQKFGLALIPQGGLAIAMVVSYLWSFKDFAAPWAINLVHISVIVNDLIAPYLLEGFEEEET